MVHTGCPRGGETILSWGPLVYGDQLTRPIQYVANALQTCTQISQNR